MIRRLISVITTFASFIGLLVIGNNALANPYENSTITQAPSTNVMKAIDLNVSSPFWELNSKISISLSDQVNPSLRDNVPHLGCSCAVCTKGTKNL